MSKLIVGVHNTPSGRLSGNYILEMDGATEVEMLEHAMFRSTFDYVAGRKVYRPNNRLVSAITAGDYKFIPAE